MLFGLFTKTLLSPPLNSPRVIGFSCNSTACQKSSILLKVRQQNSVINNLKITNACHPMKILFVYLARVNEKTQASKTGRKDWRHLGKELPISFSLGFVRLYRKTTTNEGAGANEHRVASNRHTPTLPPAQYWGSRQNVPSPSLSLGGLHLHTLKVLPKLSSKLAISRAIDTILFLFLSLVFRAFWFLLLLICPIVILMKFGRWRYP